MIFITYKDTTRLWFFFVFSSWIINESFNKCLTDWKSCIAIFNPRVGSSNLTFIELECFPLECFTPVENCLLSNAVFLFWLRSDFCYLPSGNHNITYRRFSQSMFSICLQQIIFLNTPLRYFRYMVLQTIVQRQRNLKIWFGVTSYNVG
jgi:hypothetical protein